jgi:thiol-disulfide isomerase/thioredoxin
MQSLSYASPKALLNALLPQTNPTSLQNPTDTPVDRVAAFKRFISDVESRGGGDIVPEFPVGADWLNAPPLRLDRELRGKVLILDFWTYCCINCMHILPDLAYLENKFQGQEVTVVGVHSAKFDNEKATKNIRDAVLRYDVRHPVVNDVDMTLWRALGVSSWPTVAVVSPTGKLLLSLSGEGHRRDLDDILTAALEYYGEQGMLNATPVPEALEKNKDSRLATSPLRFPGKIAIDAANSRLFISDSGNHRIVVTELNTGKFIASYGGNGPGLRDGPGDVAAFNRPQGLTNSSTTDSVFVCDTENHAIREILLKTGQVRTIVGDGVKGDNDYRGGAAGAEQRLNSPWDCLLLEDNNDTINNQVLLVAIAGQHQIWRVDIATGVAAAVSGTGAEQNKNGPTGLTTAWAQPSGLALVAKNNSNNPGQISLEDMQVLVADSESSSIRRLVLKTGGASACVGGDLEIFTDNLFKFGDVDGNGSNAALQHPLAVAATSPTSTIAWVADSYNHRLKRLDASTCTIATVAGSGQAGFADGVGTAAQLSEPGGLAVSPIDGRVFIADTNNSLIRSYDPKTAKISTLQLQGVPKPTISPDAALVWTGNATEMKGGIPPGAVLVKSSTSLVLSSSAGSRKNLNVRIALPSGYHLTQGANSRFECSLVGNGGSIDSTVEFTPKKGPLQEEGESTVAATISLNVTSSAASENSAVRVLCTVYFCQDKSVCLFQEIVFEVPLVVTAGAVENNTIDLLHTLSADRKIASLPVL